MAVITYLMLETMTTFRVLVGAALLSLALALPAQAGYITIDHFTIAAGSDGLGVRSEFGNVSINTTGSHAQLTASVGQPLARLTYNFGPTPISVLPVFRVWAQNTSSSSDHEGILRVNVNGGTFIPYTLDGAQGGYTDYTFDFTSQFAPGAASISELRVEWIRPVGVGVTGSRQLHIDLIDVQEVPEPATLALIGLASGGGGIAAYRRRRKAIAVKK